jgi:undecaprenyl diphosphate synthase
MDSLLHHVAIIPDGNRRWARERNLPTLMGHKKGADNAIELLKTAKKERIHTMTMWGFSTENWNRSKEEVDYLMNIFSGLLDRMLKHLMENDTRFYHLGRRDRLSEKLISVIEKIEKETLHNKSHVFNIALDYGGQDEILRAIERAEKEMQMGKITLKDLFEKDGLYSGKYPYYNFKNYLDTRDQPHPYPDLIIRTSGETRTSGFMLWQSVYSEFYFSQKHFPDFTPSEFTKAINEFKSRQRRFGGG